LRAYTFDNSVSEALRCEEVAIYSRVTNGKWDQFLISLSLHFSVGVGVGVVENINVIVLWSHNNQTSFN